MGGAESLGRCKDSPRAVLKIPKKSEEHTEVAQTIFKKMQSEEDCKIQA
jgi:hypothetical protein